MKKMKTNYLFILLFILLFACHPEKTGSEVNTGEMPSTLSLSPAQLKSAGISTDTLKQAIISRYIKASGRVEAPPQNYISVSAPLGGFLRSTDLLPGMKVKKGSVLAWMEDQQYIQLQEQYLLIKSELLMSEKDFVRQKELNVDKTASDKSLEQAQASLEGKKALYAGLREKLKMAGIQPDQLTAVNLSRAAPLLSPIDGYVAKINVNVGKYVQPQDALFELVNPEDIHLALTIFEKDIAGLKEGQKVSAWTNNGIRRYDCEIILLGRNIGADHSIDVHCHFINYDHSLLPGMFMNAEIATSATMAYVLPQEAVTEYAGKSYVFVAETSSNFRMQEITAGSASDGNVIIKNAESLLAKQIVVKGAYSLLMLAKNVSDE